MIAKSILSILISIVISASVVNACAVLKYENLTQPDGTIINVFYSGDEKIGGYKTLDGYGIIKDGDNWWKYSEEGPIIDDKLKHIKYHSIKPSIHKVGKIDPTKINLKKNIFPEIVEDPYGYQTATTYSDGSGSDVYVSTFYDPIIGTQNILVLLLQFTDKNGESSAGSIDTKLFGSTDSVNAYYKEVSYDSINVVGYVYPVWLDSSHNSTYYGEDVANGTTDNKYTDDWSIIQESVNLANLNINFANYDTDSDTFVDHLMIVVAGDDQRTDNKYINPKRVPNGGSPISVDNVKIRSAMVVAENTVLGTYAHELAHDLASWDSGRWLGLPEKTNEEILDAINNALANMEDYDWMNKE